MVWFGLPQSSCLCKHRNDHAPLIVDDELALHSYTGIYSSHSSVTGGSNYLEDGQAQLFSPLLAEDSPALPDGVFGAEVYERFLKRE